jgi:hypothetical protein
VALYHRYSNLYHKPHNNISTRGNDFIRCFLQAGRAFIGRLQPKVNHLRVLGYPTYILILEETRVTSKKLKPRAELGILIGYKSNYIYRVYVLSKRYDKIICSSNCKFDKGGVYTNKYIYLYKSNNKEIK